MKKKKIFMEICKRCIMDSTIPGFKLDTKGICNFCLYWKKNKDKYISFSDVNIKDNLSSIKKEVQTHTKKFKNKYDCIVGLSGGIDSSFVVYNLWKMGLNPLVIHLDNGWGTLNSNSNISKILEKTNFDYKTLVLDWEEFSNLQLSFLKAGVPDIELPTDHAILAYIYNYALKNNIKYIFSGVNFATEHSIVPAWGWRKDDYNHIKKIHKLFGKVKLKNYPNIIPFKKFYHQTISKKIKVINLLDQINYNSTKASEILSQEYGWMSYEAKHHESFFTMFFQTYILPKKFGIDKRKLHYSCLIRNHELTRDKALESLSLPAIDSLNLTQNKNFFLKKMLLTNEEFENIMLAEPKKHSDYSINWTQSLIFKFIKNQIKKILK